MYDKLKQDGIANGMCQQFRDEWQDPTLPELCWMFFRGMDFCIEHNWPKMELIRETFSPEELAEYGIYINDGIARDQLNVCVMDDADVHVYVPDLGTCSVYARHNSHVHIHLGYKAFCYVSVYNNATVYLDKKEQLAKIKCSYYGGMVVDAPSFDKIVDKTKKEG